MNEDNTREFENDQDVSSMTHSTASDHEPVYASACLEDYSDALRKEIFHLKQGKRRSHKMGMRTLHEAG